MPIFLDQCGLDTRHRGWNRRYYALLNANREPILYVQANLYFPDCFNWKKLYKKGWSVHVVGADPPKGVIDEARNG